MDHPDKKEQQNDHRRKEEGEDGAEEAEQKRVVLAGVAMGLAQVADDEAVVAAVGLPGDVEDVSEDGDGANDDGNAEVDEHADEGDVRDAANPRGDDEDRGGDAGEDVAEAGDEADEAVETEADAGAGDVEAVVEEVGVEVEVLVGEPAGGAGARAGWSGWCGGQDFGIWQMRHGIDHWEMRCGAGRERCAADVTIGFGMAAIVQRQNA
jgi:hypothetical protein